MSDDGDAWGVVVFVAVIIAACLMCYAAGMSNGSDTMDNKWRDRLVDNPDYVAAIKSEVLAERVVKALEE